MAQQRRTVVITIVTIAMMSSTSARIASSSSSFSSLRSSSSSALSVVSGRRCGALAGARLGRTGELVHLASSLSGAPSTPVGQAAFISSAVARAPPCGSRNDASHRRRHTSLQRFASSSSDSSVAGYHQNRGTEGAATSSSSLSREEKVMQDMLKRVRRVNRVPGDVRASLIDFVVEGKRVGKVTPDTASLLSSTGPPVFRLVDNDGHVDDGTKHGERSILTLDPTIAGSTCQSRTDAVMTVMSRLRDDGIVTGWRDELYPVSETFYDSTNTGCGGSNSPLLCVERAATPLLGTVDYGVHINGLVRLPKGGSNDDGGEEVMMWIARRSKTKSKYAGMLDHIVAGGQPAGMTLIDNVVKECQEEAGVPASLARSNVRPGGAVSYEYQTMGGYISRAVLFCFDLDLPVDFVPVAVDGEVDEFFLWSIDQVKDSMDPDYPDPIKPNCYPVIVDYLLRAGHVSPETRGYLDLLQELRGGFCG